MNLLTVILTTYNRSHYLRFALEALLNQTYKEFDIIVINNGSTDNTEEVIKSYRDNRIKYIKYDTNGRIIKNFRVLCNTKYLLLIHDDDIMEPTMVERELQIFETDKDEEVVAVACATKIINENNQIIEVNRLQKTFPGESKDILFEKYDYHRMFCDTNGEHVIITWPTIMYRKKAFDALPFDVLDGINKVGDICIILWLNEAGKMYLINDPLYCYRSHGGQERADLPQLSYQHILPLLVDRVSKEQYLNIKKHFNSYVLFAQANHELANFLSRCKNNGFETSDKNLQINNHYIGKKEMSHQQYFAEIMKRVEYLQQIFANKKVNYVIWGADISGENTKTIFDEFLTNFNLLGFIDSYRKGSFLGYPIQSPEEYDFCSGAYIVVAISSSGLEKVVFGLEKRGLNMPDDFTIGYTIIR